MEIKFDVKMTQKIMYNFLLNHTYRSMAGIVGTLFGIFAIGLFGFTLGDVPEWQSMLYLLFGVWFLLYLPVNLFLRSGKQVKANPVFKKPITYVLNEEGITTMQEDQKVVIKWEDIYKVTETKLSLLVYTGKRYSFVLPKESMGGQYEAAVKLMKEHMNAKQIKIKER